MVFSLLCLQDCPLSCFLIEKALSLNDINLVSMVGTLKGFAETAGKFPGPTPGKNRKFSKKKEGNYYCWWFRKPVNSPVEVGSLSTIIYVGFLLHPRWVFSPGFWTINSTYSPGPVNLLSRRYMDGHRVSHKVDSWKLWMNQYMWGMHHETSQVFFHYWRYGMRQMCGNCHRFFYVKELHPLISMSKIWA